MERYGYMEGKKAKIGLIQVSNVWNRSVKFYLDEMLALAENCLKEGADLVFMPEAYQYRIAYATRSIWELTTEYAADYKKACSDLAKKYSAYIVPWDYEISGEGKIFNMSYILDRDGVEIGRYRKVQITYEEEFKGVSQGCDFPVFDLDIGKVGIMICFDNYFPESARILALKGAELILFPLYGDTMKEQWEIKLRARAIDNSVYIASCCLCTQASFTGMVDPGGNVICRLNEKENYRVVEIEMGKRIYTNTSAKKGQYEDIKQYLLKSRNVKAYGMLTERIDVWEWDDIITCEEEHSCEDIRR